ncbi:Halomucin [Frankliniella fusca]|uniref:Halomucin n=1 Tax=Frankliniella fusca TaxID=407009 RepID=A0AAE1GVT9_9NEOP|nr:Halomucin [Frankliniella fusca]
MLQLLKPLFVLPCLANNSASLEQCDCSYHLEASRDISIQQDEENHTLELSDDEYNEMEVTNNGEQANDFVHLMNDGSMQDTKNVCNRNAASENESSLLIDSAQQVNASDALHLFHEREVDNVLLHSINDSSEFACDVHTQVPQTASTSNADSTNIKPHPPEVNEFCRSDNDNDDIEGSSSICYSDDDVIVCALDESRETSHNSSSSDSEGNADSEPDGDPGGSDDPDDPDDVNNGSSSESDSDPDADMAVGARNFSLQNQNLDQVLEAAAGRTAREVVAMVMALAVRNNLNYETTIKFFSIIDATMQGNYLPLTKDQMWACLNRNATGLRKNAYCSDCYRSLGFWENLPNQVVCQCDWTQVKSKVRYFITLNVRSQLEAILSKPGIWEKLQYPQHRQKSSPEAIEDILDGREYQRIRQAPIPLTPYEFTYNFNLDGLRVSKSSKTEVWPIFIRINEFPPNLRQSNGVLAGLWLDSKYVNFRLFMKTFAKQSTKLASNGVRWKPNGNDEQVSRFRPACCVADAKGRAGILNMAQYSGSLGCPFCEHQGIKLLGSMRYPIPGTVVNRVRVIRRQEYIERVVIPPAPLRTDNGIRNAMTYIGEHPGVGRIRGVIGPSNVMLLPHFDLAKGCSTDDLHPIYKGITETFTGLLLDGVQGVYNIGVNERAIITRRLESILTPSHITRKPRSIDLVAMWKASEWRNWLLYYAIVCLVDIVPQRYLRLVGLLSNAVFLLSRDVILEENLVEAHRCIEEFVRRFQDLYGPGQMNFSVHILTHLVECVRNWGPLFCHSTFPFESWNHHIAKAVSSPKGAIDQIAMRFLMKFMVDGIPEDPDISQEVKDIIHHKVMGKKLHAVRTLEGAHFLGQPIHRDASEREVQILAAAGYHQNQLTEYCRMKWRGLECRSLRYRADLQSNNTLVYTTEDEFGVVHNIVVLEGAHVVAGIFVQFFMCGDGLHGASHVVPILQNRDVEFVTINEIRNLAIKIKLGEQWYITPMANQHEID